MKVLARPGEYSLPTMSHPAGIPLVTALLAGLSPRPAGAREAACPSVSLEADAAVSARWPGLARRVHEELDTREDIDRCARIELTCRDGSTAVHVLLPDGRSASRPAPRPEDVVPTLEALLLLPRNEAQPPPLVMDPASGPPSPDTAPPAPVLAGQVDQGEPPPGAGDVAPRPLARAGASVGIDLSAAVGARMGDGQAGVGLGALSFLDVSGWLVGFEGRLDRYQKLGPIPPGGAPQGAPPDGGGVALELALLGGRRVRYGSVSVDFVLGAAAAVQGTSTMAMRGPMGAQSQSSSSTVPRLVLASRLNFAARSALRTFVGLDGDVGPARADDMPSAPRLPVWTLGLALGATVGTR
jgi:hypothetical protein